MAHTNSPQANTPQANSPQANSPQADSPQADIARAYIERELKFDVDPGFVVPDVTRLLPPGGQLTQRTELLRSDYFDTVDRALLRAKVTLRRRSGTADRGWQLKVPFESFREEIRIDAEDGAAPAPGHDTGHDTGADVVPDELRALVLGIGRGQQLVHLATLSTERLVTGLLDADGSVLAEIADDRVQSFSGRPAAVSNSWREVEVELGGEDLQLLRALSKDLRKVGARPSASSSKLARSLRETPGARAKNSKPRAADIIAAYVREQQQAIIAGDLALRRAGGTAAGGTTLDSTTLDSTVIHRTRVATRRLRSTLRSFAGLYDGEGAAALDAELAWFAALLGEVRDREVLQARLDALLADLDETLQLGPVKARIDGELSRERRQAWQALQRELAGERYLDLLTTIDGWVKQPPWSGQAARPAAVVAKLARRAEHTVARRLTHANVEGDIELLHRARKSAKRARYAAEAAEPVIGAKAARREAGRYQQLQDLLGEHQDSVVSAELLRRLGAKAGTTKGENGFAFGILHERELQNARVVRAKARRVAKKYT